MSKKEIKKRLINSLIKGERMETKKLNEKVSKVEKCEEATSIITKYEHIIRTKNKNIMCIVYHQGKVLGDLKKRKNLF